MPLSTKTATDTDTREQLLARIAELERAIASYESGRRAALNLAEDAVLAKRRSIEAEKKYRSLFESIDEGFCTIEVLFSEAGRPIDYRFLEINPAFAEQTGLENAAGKTIRELAPDHEEFWFETFGTIALTGEARRFEHEAAALDRFFDVYAFRTGAPGENRVAILFNDIFARKKAEAALRESEASRRLALDAANMGTFVWYPKEKRGHPDERMLQLFGLPPNRTLDLASDLPGLVHPADRATYKAAIKKALDPGGDGLLSCELRILHEGRGVRWLSISAHTVFEGEPKQAVRIYGVAADITEKMLRSEELRKANEMLEEKVLERTAELAATNKELKHEIKERESIEKDRVHLLHQVVTTQEAERQRIARDLHDHLGQRLTAFRLKLASLRNGIVDPSDMSEPLERLQEIAEHMDSEVGFLAGQLRPSALDDLGLVQALKDLTVEWSEHFGVPIHFHSNLRKNDRLPGETETHLYRIAQEALNNIAKYAQAREAALTLEKTSTDGVILLIGDNGSGFHPHRNGTPEPGKGLGLVGMAERASLIGADLEIESAPGEGTTIIVRVSRAPGV